MSIAINMCFITRYISIYLNGEFFLSKISKSSMMELFAAHFYIHFRCPDRSIRSFSYSLYIFSGYYYYSWGDFNAQKKGGMECFSFFLPVALTFAGMDLNSQSASFPILSFVYIFSLKFMDEYI